LLFPILIYRWEETFLKKILTSFAVIVLTIYVCNLYDLEYFEINNLPGYAGLIYINPLIRVFEFLIGMITALIYKKYFKVYSVGSIVGSVIEILAISCVLILLLKIYSLSKMVSSYIGEAGTYWINIGGLNSIFYGILILVFSFHSGVISKLIKTKIFVWLGEISFSIYLLHDLFIRYYRQNFEGHINLPNWMIYLYFWIFLITVANFLWIYIELPCRHYLCNYQKYKYLFMNKNIYLKLKKIRIK
jgi:peptidoglycan/LPS O-acetylase OafA/YrhL